MTRWWDGIDASSRTAVLALGDVVAIGLFVIAGELRHYPVEIAFQRTPGTLVPFLLGWTLAAPLAGLYARGHRRAVPAALRTALAWIGATGVAMALRSLETFHGSADLTFALVSVGVGIVLLVPWRLLATRA